MEQRAGPVVDNSDWLKTAAIILVAVDHFGYFFIENADWWSVIGRMAAPVFFFLLGYANSRTVPLRWIWLGFILTLLDSWNNDWNWVAPNILFSLAIIRLIRPHVRAFLQHRGWVAIAVLIAALLAALPLAGEMVEYGAEGWLWALLGLLQRMYVDSKPVYGKVDATGRSAEPKYAMEQNFGLMRLLACFIAAIVYLWREQLEFLFTPLQLSAFILGVVILSISLCLFRRGPSAIQPPALPARTLRFIGWHTLEIYFLQLAGSELIVGFLPELAP